MVYLDYSATTMVDDKVLKRFNNVVKNNYANPNSNHEIGLESHKIIDTAIKNIEDKLNLKNKEIIFTSGASEANNFVLKGLSTNKKHIISTPFEHSSIITPLGFLQKNGYKVDFVNVDEFGIVDIDNLKELINEDTFLISIGAVNSEIGIRQPIEEIAKLLKEDKYKDIYFHSDITQCLGKDKIDLTNVDLASFSAHKIYSFKGIGGLIKNKDIKLNPLIHGGKSTSIYRSGTPQTELIDSISTAIDLIYKDFDKKYQYVKKINEYIKENIKKYESIKINSNKYSIPHILNISILGKNSDDTQKYFSDKKIYISTKTACSSDNSLSLSVKRLTNDEERASSSIRISLSYKTTKKEIDEFLKVLDQYMKVR